MPKHFIVYAHGFGVRKDDRGLFTDIAGVLPDAEHVMIDLSQFDEQTGRLTVPPLQTQAATLTHAIKNIDRNEGDTVDIVCHSQGCMVAALAQPERIRKVIFLAPPDSNDMQRLITMFSERPGTHLDTDGESALTRSDGSTTIVPAAYWPGLRQLNVKHLYKQLSATTELVIVASDDDNVLGKTDFSDIGEHIRYIEKAGDHDFSGAARKQMLELIQVELRLV